MEVVSGNADNHTKVEKTTVKQIVPRVSTTTIRTTHFKCKNKKAYLNTI